MNERPPPCFMHMDRNATWHITWDGGVGNVNLCDECRDAVRDLIETLEPLPEPEHGSTAQLDIQDRLGR